MMAEQSVESSTPEAREIKAATPEGTWLALLLAIDAALARATTNAEAGLAVLARLGEAGGFAAGNLYRIDDALRELRCEEHWYPPGRSVPALESISRRTWFARGEGLPGEAWASAALRSIPDLGAEPDFHRAFWAAKDGLRSVCAFPLTAGGEVLGVIELFGRTPRTLDPTLAAVLASVGARLGEAWKRRALEGALSRAQGRLASVVAHAPLVLFTLDPEGRFTMGAGRGLAALGVSGGSLRGKSAFDIYRDSPQILADIRAAIRGEAFTSIVQVGSSELHYETRYTPVRGPDGAVTEVIGVAIDITDRQRAESALKRSEARLIEVDRLASLGTLAAGVAHEINNPLSYVLLNLDFVVREMGVRAVGAEPPTRLSWSERRSSIPPPRAPRGRVLVVDDEPVLAAALGRSLQPEFEVEVLANGRDALERLRRAPPIDAVLCDLIMPLMTGMDVYEVLKESDPDMASRIIFMTGGSFTQRARDFLASVPNPALDKPFDLRMLEAMLRVRTEDAEP